MTIKSCVIGWPIEHSRSPLIHGHWLDQHGIDGSYTRQGVAPDDFDEFVRAMPDHGFAGGNVTVPHKEAALKCAEVADEAARQIGAANTLWFEDGKLHASNTDAYGFLANLDEGAPGWDASKPVAIVLGAGGASRAILHALLSRDLSEIRLLNRTLSRAEELAAEIVKMCTDLGGSITGEHGVGMEKRELLPSMFSQNDIEMMRRVRQQIDSKEIANPGKMFPAGEAPALSTHGLHPLEKSGTISRE